MPGACRGVSWGRHDEGQIEGELSSEKSLVRPQVVGQWRAGFAWGCVGRGRETLGGLILMHRYVGHDPVRGQHYEKCSDGPKD